MIGNMTKITLGVVGLNFGYRYIKELISSDSQFNERFVLKGVCDIDSGKCSKVAAEFEVNSYHDIQDMVKDDSIEAIALFIGPNGRAEIIDGIISAGKDVITTKPFELCPFQAQNILEKANKLGRIVHINSPSPIPASDIQQILNWKQEYGLGDVVSLNWQTWCSYSEDSDGSWYDDPEKCPVAPIFRLGIYAINDILWLVNDPKEVQVCHSNMITRRPTPDNAYLVIKFGNGAVAGISANFCCSGGNPYCDRMVINFERGVVYKNLDPLHDNYSTGTKLQLVTGSGDNVFTLKADFPYSQSSGAYQWDAFYKAVKGTMASSVCPTQVVDGIKIVRAMQRAECSHKCEPV